MNAPTPDAGGMRWIAEQAHRDMQSRGAHGKLYLTP